MTGNGKKENVKEYEIYALAMDPIYIGTGGYKIGRVDNTIVRDPTTRLPKIPGSSLAGTWRYYVALRLHECFKDDELKINRRVRKEKTDIFKTDSPEWVKNFEGNKYTGIKCAGQDDASNVDLDDEKNTGHCGRCIVCKGFGFSKKNLSWQGMIFFSDLNILFFPVFTMKGTKWITTVSKLKDIGINETEPDEYKVKGKNLGVSHINLGWLYLEVDEDHNIEKNKIPNIKGFDLEPKDIIIVPEDLFSHIVNSNLEVRTSVSIDPITGAAKEGALFTSEAVPRGTIFYGKIRIFNKKNFEDINDNLKPLPSVKQLKDALESSKDYFETLGIGGMTTRGFGRLKISIGNNKENKGETQEKSESGGSNGEQ